MSKYCFIRLTFADNLSEEEAEDMINKFYLDNHDNLKQESGYICMRAWHTDKEEFVKKVEEVLDEKDNIISPCEDIPQRTKICKFRK